MNKNELKQTVLDYLEQNRLMSLATVNEAKPWASTVFFSFDSNLNILFYSDPKTVHCKNIERNPHVAITVSQAWKDESGGIQGLQITGTAQKVTKKDYEVYYNLYKNRHNWVDEFKSDHILYIIKPSEIYFISEKLFGHFHRVQI